MLGYEYQTRMLFTRTVIILLGLIIFVVGLLPILKTTILSEQLAMLPSNPLIYQILTVVFGLGVMLYAVKHINTMY